MKNPGTGILLALLFICQSCTVYHKTPVSIEDAVNKGKVKLVKTTVHEGQASEVTKDFNNIGYDDNRYFGLYNYKLKNGQKSADRKTQIKVDESMSFYLRNRGMSRRKSFLAFVGTTVVIAALLGIATYDKPCIGC